MRNCDQNDEKKNTLIGVIKEMGVIEPSDLAARLYTTESRMATGEVKREHH